ncbi:glycosyltransferase [Granulicella sp. S156]|uniref:glycosyltransferase n=1 Tax=Granulicella sp. S156 TaxID=1747224 RepID=UPI0020B108CF|nr:glycosyltransferase [Granulicella sp. S156]
MSSLSAFKGLRGFVILKLKSLTLFMRVAQAVFGVFHHFELARELERRGHLDRVYSTWPWSRLQREGLPRDKVKTFPWLHLPQIALQRSPFDLPVLDDHLGYANALTFDRWTDRQFERNLRRGEPSPDVLIAISGAGLLTGRNLQERGGIFVCDRGSTHQRYQENIVAEEYRRWGVERQVSDERDTMREEAIYAQADAITVPSSMAARSFVEMGVPAAKVHTIPYGVRLENFHPVGEPPQGELRVLFAGAVGLRKGIPYLLQAFSELRHPSKRLLIAGQMQEDLRSVLPKCPQENVEFLGAVPQPRLVELMSTSHVLVLPSIEEGLALVQAQALACGCPVICSTNTGGEDLFSDGVEGFIVPIRDSGAIAARLQQLADDPLLQARMRAAALARVQAIGGWTQYGDRWEPLLRDLLASSRSGRAAASDKMHNL